MSGSGGGDIDMLSCANCGKGEEDSIKLKKCSACLSVKYCSNECQKAHRSQHKKECKKRAAELYDEKLFTEVEREECPICMLTLPLENNTKAFNPCCGKLICSGCVYAMKMSEGKDLCAFCRAPTPSSEGEQIKRLKKLMKKGNAEAISALGSLYRRGYCGLTQDRLKANELCLKAGKLGSAEAYYNLGITYDQGRGVEVDKKKAKHYYELASMGGCVEARNNLACLEATAGNLQRAYKHFILAARAGHKISLDNIKIGFMKEDVTKEEYASTLRCFYDRQAEMKSDSREKAEAYYGHLS